MTLQIAPTHWLSSDFTVLKDSQTVANVEVSRWGEKGALSIDRTSYRMYREGWLSGAFVLERDGSVVARAEKAGVFHRKYLVRYGDREYTLAARSMFRRPFAVLDGSTEIGSIERTTVFTREAKADLPDAWPLPLRAFVIWLAWMQWRRDAAGS